jgi:hypothetical protein
VEGLEGYEVEGLVEAWEGRLVHWLIEGGGGSLGKGRVPMLFMRHVYSSWYRRHNAAIDEAFSSPKWVASSLAMDSVERMVP